MNLGTKFLDFGEKFNCYWCQYVVFSGRTSVAVFLLGISYQPLGKLSTLPRGSEVILLAEDEDTVRRLTRTFLANWGYQILEARHGGEGVALCRNHQGPIHLLITDILMPQMGGRELAQEARLLHPEIKVLFISGYTDDMLILEGIKVEGTPFLQKPFTLQELGSTVREVLDRTEAKF